MALQPKERAGAEFRRQAQQLRDELLDDKKQLTQDEVKQKSDGIAALLARAVAVEGITPEAEVKDQGGDLLLRQAAPENADSDVPEVAFGTRYEQVCKETAKAFGSTKRYIDCMTGRRQPTTRQSHVMQAIRDLTRAAIVGTTSDGSGGEFLLPLQQVAAIFRVENVQQGILQSARRYPVAGRTLRIPYVKQTDAAVTRPLAGITNISIIGEGSTKDEYENVFAQRLLTVFKYAAVTKMSDEIIEDDLTNELVPTVMAQIGQEVLNQMNYDMTILGGGTTNSVGALHTSANPALIKITRATQNSITAADAFNMMAQFTGGPNSRWFITRTGLAKLWAMNVTNTAFVTFLQNLRDPVGQAGVGGGSIGTLLGYPVVVSDFMNALGSESDFALVNPDFYAAAIRQQLTVESSIHVEFVKDLTTYRFVARGGGIPIPDGTYAYRSPSGTKVAPHSPFVTLDDVYA